MQIETTKNLEMLKAMLDSVTAQIERTPEEDSSLLEELSFERDRVRARINVLTSGE